MKDKINSWLDGFLEPAKNNIKSLICNVTPLLLFCIYLVFFQTVRVSSDSMFITLATGDLGIARRTWTGYTPERADIVCFDHDNLLYIKRVIGLPGETVSFKDGWVYIDGELLDEPYLSLPGYTYEYTQAEYEVPEDSVFVMGDNRMNSQDARFWDDPYLKISEIKSQYLKTIWKVKR